MEEDFLKFATILTKKVLNIRILCRILTEKKRTFSTNSDKP